MANVEPVELAAAGCLVAGLLHVLGGGAIRERATSRVKGGAGQALLMLLSESEVAVMVWATVFLGVLAFVKGGHVAVVFVDGLDMTEPVYVFAVFVASAVRPVIGLCDQVIGTLARLVPLPDRSAFVLTALVTGPLIGSIVTEPAAMAITASLLERRVFRDGVISEAARYWLLAVLFVNVSIGGTLTSFAAPPIVMVARTFGWDTFHVFTTIGWRAALAVGVNALSVTVALNAELSRPTANSCEGQAHRTTPNCPWWLRVLHLGLIGLIVWWGHHPKLVLGVFVAFVGLASVTRSYHDPLHLRHGMMVGGFLAGLVVLCSHLGWWVRPVIAALSEPGLYYATTALTAVTDNAALTYLGSQVDLTPAQRTALVAGSVTGGGLTVIANAPNPAGASILQAYFRGGVIAHHRLLLAAILPTLVAVGCFRLLPVP